VTKAVLHIVHRSVPREELVALYCAADIMVVTPLRDGMNLVAKEYVATRVNNDGVLVLSEFTGAAAQLRDAVMINPYDVQSTSDSLLTSINMPLVEQQRRMRALRFNVRDSNVARWASAFISALESTRDVRSRRSSSSALPALGMPNVTEAVSALARNNTPVALFIDYDGTLVPFAARPNLAYPDRELLSLLAHLAKRVELHIASGRTHESLARFVGQVPHTALHAEHGLFARAADSETWVSRLTPLPPVWKTDVLGIMRDAADRSNGALIEEKTAAVVFHYRNVKQRVARRFVSELKTRLLALPSSNEFELLDGVCVLEVRPAGINKGCIITDWLAHVTAQNAATASPPPLPTVVCIGDDHTDEDMFAVCPPNAITVKVG
jgi:trehalose 6-phosphate synthase/phosphatase